MVALALTLAAFGTLGCRSSSLDEQRVEGGDELTSVQTAPTGEGAAASGPVTFTDAFGTELTIEAPERVAVATYSFAQVWLLAGGTLVGTTQDALDSDLEFATDTLSFGSSHNLDVEAIMAMNPDLLILSADIPEHMKPSEQLAAAGVPTAYLSVELFEDYLDLLKTFTAITGRADLYEKHGLVPQEQIEAIRRDCAGKPSPRILLLRSSASGVTARNSQTMTGAMLKDLGCVNIADVEGSLLENLSMEVIIREDPDFIFVVIMGGSVENAQKSLEEALLSNSAWAELDAVKNGRYRILPSDLFHLKPNQRWPESYETLAEILYG
ncbi:MAG: ABC transporter substrate-binding protein [Coriobacteriales bacterium]|jgi:iron complex transport system substrate-binding protein|nr:ABC transporter substrate-binding protein [Coriobacteriales bacterium]